MFKNRYLNLRRVEDLPDHDESERCPSCGSIMKEDPVGGFFLGCPKCGLETW